MSRSLTDRVHALGHELPATAPPLFSFVPYTIEGKIVFVSGQICQRDGAKPYVGRLGAEISLDDGVKAAELCALNILAWLKEIVDDDLDRVGRCLRLGGFVRSTDQFFDQPKVINGGSDLIVAALGDRGKHARTAVGVNALPFGVAVEIDAVFALA